MIETQDDILPVIGLEIHVELATATKMFCRCLNRFGDPPNTHAVEYSMKVALALNCTVASFTKWDRKSYYYPDLPKNYQISQYDLPLNERGFLEIPLSDGGTKTVRILRAHLEEDAGKNIHDNPSHTGVDLNRAGVPLLEIVSEPDMNSVEEVMSYARATQRLVRWLGASEANMQMGHMRFEPNINLHITRAGVTHKTPIVEVKNLNSFRSLAGAVAYEIDRQYAEWRADPEGFTLEKLGKQNRGYDDDAGKTVFQREKEEAHDYRYFPEPDLVPVAVGDEWRDEIAATISELPLARRRRYMDQYALTFEEADALTQDAPTGDLLDAAVRLGASAKLAANFLLGKVAARANERGCTIYQAWADAYPEGNIFDKAKPLADLCEMTKVKLVTPTTSSHVLAIMTVSGGDPNVIAKNKGLLAVTDSGAIEAWVDQAIAENPRAVQDVREGGKKQKKAFGFLMGQVMQKSRGAAQPAEVQRLLKKRLRG